MSVFLLAGTAGFIGAKVAEQLLAKGHFVVGVDNVNSAYDTRLKIFRLREISRSAKNFLFYQNDIEDIAALEKLFQKHSFDAVINLAARAGVRASVENPFVYMTTNAIGTLNLLELSRRNNVKKFVLASTSSLYAGQKPPFTEDFPANSPLSPYAATKKAAETLAITYHNLYKIDLSILRYFTVFGPAGRPDMCIFRFIKGIDEGTPLEIFGDGAQTRDFTYLDDIARGTVLAAETPVGCEIINLGGGGEPVPLNAVIAFIENELGKNALRLSRPFHAADMSVTAADVSKAKRLLGWTPRVSWQEGLRHTVAWHNAQRELVNKIIV
ncbi:MAG: GDP-mannose 4,6-dehydratase [Puniceicoccales bacterium]|jgi:nucleoside-diphosphate-sugar epimerase|nr:GDP-mannose 4,6-dehydratase [Puniceicoccales bacterium]